jgi:hypothetical protein
MIDLNERINSNNMYFIKLRISSSLNSGIQAGHAQETRLRHTGLDAEAPRVVHNTLAHPTDAAAGPLGRVCQYAQGWGLDGGLADPVDAAKALLLQLLATYDPAFNRLAEGRDCTPNLRVRRNGNP